jgi:hypothetical protein
LMILSKSKTTLDAFWLWCIQIESYRGCRGHNWGTSADQQRDPWVLALLGSTGCIVSDVYTNILYFYIIYNLNNDTFIH